MKTDAPSQIQQLRVRRQAQRAPAHDRPDTRSLIIDATERVLEREPLHDLTVAQVIAAAGVSRGTFYSYFASKFEVLAALLERTMEEMYDLLTPFVERPAGVSREAAIGEVLSSSTRLWRRHRVVFRATHQHWHAVPELREQWLAMVERFTAAIAAELEREIAAGAASAGIDARQRAAAVLWATEHLLHIAGTGVDDDLPSEDAILGTLEALWTGTLYGEPEGPGGRDV